MCKKYSRLCILCMIMIIALLGLASAEQAGISISSQTGNVTADEGKNAVFKVSASSSAGLELSYQWQASTDFGKNWKDSGLSGNKTAKLTVAATVARNGYQFRCVIKDTAGNSVTSDAMTLSVESYIRFNSQPLSQKVTNATKVKFKVSAESLTGRKLSYQWQASTDGGKTWKNSGLSGNKTAILVVDATAARSGYRFRCVATDANKKTLTSSAAVMTVNKVAGKTVTITSFTASQTALAGTNVKFNVGAKTSTGTALTYQWQVSTDGGKTFKTSGLAGNKTATLTVAATSGRNNYQFRCVITDAKKNSVISDAVKLTVSTVHTHNFNIPIYDTVHHDEEGHYNIKKSPVYIYITTTGAKIKLDNYAEISYNILKPLGLWKKEYIKGDINNVGISTGWEDYYEDESGIYYCFNDITAIKCDYFKTWKYAKKAASCTCDPVDLYDREYNSWSELEKDADLYMTDFGIDVSRYKNHQYEIKTWVVDKAAYDATEIVGYKCECGALFH